MDDICLLKISGNINSFKKSLELNKPDENNNNLELIFELRDSYNKPIEIENKININCRNIIFHHFTTLEMNIETLYLPIYITIKTNIENVYLFYDKKNSINPLIYKIIKINNTNTCLLKKINIKELDINSIDTYIHSRTKINFNNKNNLFFKNKNFKFINFNLGNSLNDIQKKYYLYPNLSNYIIYRAISPYKSNYIWNKVRSWNNKKKYIIYPGTITNDKDKNQVNFAKLLNPKIVQDYTIIFTGDQNKNGYSKKSENKLKEVLNKKNVKFKIIKCNNNFDFFDILIKSKALIFYGVNPIDRVRVLTEGLYANLPFIVNDKITTVPESYFNYGFKVKNNDANDLNIKIKELLKKDWKFEPYLFTKKNFQIDNISREIVDEINKITDK